MIEIIKIAIIGGGFSLIGIFVLILWLLFKKDTSEEAYHEKEGKKYREIRRN